jgi:hypothetical protein
MLRKCRSVHQTPISLAAELSRRLVQVSRTDEIDLVKKALYHCQVLERKGGGVLASLHAR